MQINKTEILLPLNVKKSLSRKYLLSMGIIGFCILGLGLFLLASRGEPIPTASERLFPIFLISFAGLILLLSTIALILIRQHEQHVVRINHDGFLFPQLLSTGVKWSEISALVPYTQIYLGQQVTALAIVPQDTEKLLSRIFEDRSRSFLSRFFSKLNLSFYLRSHAFSPLLIPQAISPISIDELISVIQEQFARELSEHHVAILEWQHIS
jgi:hypothetical protein